MVLYCLTNNKKRAVRKEITDIIRNSGNEVVEKFVGGKNKVGLPREFDAMIVDIKGPSVDINYQIILALTEKKPVLCVYDENSKAAKSLPAARGTIAKNLILKTYNTETLSSVISDFITSLAEGSKPERFNFFLTPDLKEYVNWIPSGTGMTKSNFIRQLIRDRMKKDEEYRTFSKTKKK